MDNKRNVSQMKTYVLVQGGNMSTETWNVLSGQKVNTENGHMGASYWDGTVDALETAGHLVFAPTLGDEFSSTLTEHITQIIELVEENDLQDIILVGHSYGGFVITGVADKIPERIHLLVYIDSGLPDTGQSLIDLLSMVYSHEDYKSALPDPNPPYIEKLYYKHKRIQQLKKVYIRCTHSNFISATRLAKEKIDNDKEGWIYYEIPSSHVPMADMPEELYKILLDIALL